MVFRDDDKQGRVDGIHTFANNGALAAALAPGKSAATVVGAASNQERLSVLEVVALDVLAQRLAGRERLAVAGVDVSDLALRDSDEPGFVDRVLPAPIAEMHAAAKQRRLEAGLAIERDNLTSRDRALGRPELFNDSYRVVRDRAQANPYKEQNHKQDRELRPPRAKPGHDRPEHFRFCQQIGGPNCEIWKHDSNLLTLGPRRQLVDEMLRSAPAADGVTGHCPAIRPAREATILSGRCRNYTQENESTQALRRRMRKTKRPLFPKSRERLSIGRRSWLTG
jgi:hypothetical protein